MGNCLDKKAQERSAADHDQFKEAQSGPGQDSAKGSNAKKTQKVVSELSDFHISSNDFVSHKKTSIYDDYSILGASLGTGSFGEVHKGIHKPTNIMRAIKFISKELTNADERERLLNEVEILKNLDHPNIIKIFECYEDETKFYIVTELCNGGELYDKIKSNKVMTDKEAAVIMQQILSAINYCHSNNIVHRDLKPENVLYESQKGGAHLKVIDFGTSKIFKPNQKLSQKFGTPFYVAPEVLNGVYDYKCDIWSCGVILYILLSGRPPFYAPTEPAILEMVKKGVYSFEGPEWDEVSSDAKDLISKMLQMDPENRISAADALKHPWIEKMLSKDTVPKPVCSKVLENLKKFSVNQKVQQGLWFLMANTMMSQSERTVLTDVFKSLDTDGNGRLSYDELIQGYTKMLGSEEEAKMAVNSIMANIDANNSGSIDYSEFVSASVNRKQMMSKEKIEQLFSWIDKDGSKSISHQELREILGGGRGDKVSEGVWKQLISEIDIDGDGEVAALLD